MSKCLGLKICIFFPYPEELTNRGSISAGLKYPDPNHKPRLIFSYIFIMKFYNGLFSNFQLLLKNALEKLGLRIHLLWNFTMDYFLISSYYWL